MVLRLSPFAGIVVVYDIAVTEAEYHYADMNVAEGRGTGTIPHISDLLYGLSKAQSSR